MYLIHNIKPTRNSRVHIIIHSDIRKYKRAKVEMTVIIGQLSGKYLYFY